ncbi:hypothetical protein [Pedobacter antarcticus]|uniref:hypothetical protein n=1 Tax=Pedobacter antarcticus TaxID=34086 RepID=UPI002930CCF2|nr:hypothetical protein [Pedobacter antarcticus]
MKSTKEYITQELKSLVKEFDQIKASYRYDRLCETFYIQILPSKFYKESEALIERRFDILDEFLDLFPNESIVFLTEGNLINMDSVELCVQGKMYGTNKFISKVSNYKSFNFELELPVPSNDLSYENNYALAA